MGRFSKPEPQHNPKVDPSEFDDPFFGGGKKNAYANLGKEDKQLVQPYELTPEEQLKMLHEVVLKLDKQPDAELSQIEASLVYAVDKDLPTDETQQLADAIKTSRGEHDYEQVKSLIIERLRSEKNVIETAQALSHVVDGLGLSHEIYSPKEYMKALIATMKDWEERGVYDYLTHELIANNNRHNIVPVPNEGRLGEAQLVALAKKFGKQPDGSGQPYETWVDDNPDDENAMYGHQRFADNPSVLTGYTPEAGPIRLSLMPTKFNAKLGQKPAADQLSSLTQLQAEAPELNLHVPSQFDAVIHWFVLRAQGDKLADNTTFYKTFVRSIDVEPQRLGGNLCVPNSSVSDDGGPGLFNSFAHNGNFARVAVR